jgi:hypothetical protein
MLLLVFNLCGRAPGSFWGSSRAHCRGTDRLWVCTLTWMTGSGGIACLCPPSGWPFCRVMRLVEASHFKVAGLYLFLDAAACGRHAF